MLDRHLADMLKAARQAGAPDFADLPLIAARQIYTQIMAATAPEPAPGIRIAEQLIPSPGGNLRLRVYYPSTGSPEQGVALYLHGGGFVVGSPEDYEPTVTHLCEQSQSIIVQVDYRLAPEHPFPAAIDDAWAALCWVADQATQLGASPRIAVVGDSAGGNLAAVLAILARDRGGPAIVQQTLIYPTTDPTQHTMPSYELFGEGYTLTTRTARSWMGQYLLRAPLQPDSRVSPLLCENLSALPPALVLIAGYDILRDEGIAYAKKLAEVGVPVSLVEYHTMTHGFLGMAGMLETPRLALAQIADALKRALSAQA